MERQIQIAIAALVFASCSSTRVQHIQTTPSEIQQATRNMMKVCIPGDDDLVRCPKADFREYGKTCMGCGKQLQREQAENQALRQTGALDLQAEQARAAEIQRKLDSPWRSWWLWSLIGATVTAVTLTAVYWAQD